METLARLIDHAVLKPDSTIADNETGCRTALEYQVAGLCVMPCWVEFCAEFVSRSPVRLGTVIGFPHGSAVTAAKLREAELALRDGARELDAVVNFSRVLSGDWGSVTREIAALTETAHAGGAIVKFIFENCYLSGADKIRLCRICSEAGADFVKTSTGFGPGGALEEDVRLMVDNVSAGTRVKAAGGIRDLDRALAMKEAGAARIGTSSTAAILDGYRARQESTG